MYTIIQKIYEENKKILQEGLKNVFKGEDISSLIYANQILQIWKNMV